MKVEMHEGKAESPTEAAKQKPKMVTFEAPDGRKITLRQLLPFDVYNFDKFAGGLNEKQYQTLLAVYHVAAIDGADVPKSSLMQVEHLLQRLGPAFNEVQAEVMIMNADQTKGLMDLMEKVKNALSTPSSEAASG